MAGFAAFCWGSATVMSKSALDAVSPVALLVVQLGASSLVIWSLILVTRRPQLNRRSLLLAAALGLLEPGIAYLLGLIGLVHVLAGDATLIQASEAIMIVVLSALVLREPPSIGFVLLSVVALVGLTVALGVIGPRSGQSSPFGIAMIAVATATAAVYVVMSSRLITEDSLDPVVLVGVQQLSALALALLALPVEAVWSDSGLRWPTGAEAWMIAGISGVVQYAIAFSAYMYALTRITANVAGSFLNLTPVFGIGVAAMALNETLSLPQLFGATVTLVAVTLIQLRDTSTTAH